MKTLLGVEPYYFRVINVHILTGGQGRAGRHQFLDGQGAHQTFHLWDGLKTKTYGIEQNITLTKLVIGTKMAQKINKWVSDMLHVHN